MSLLSSYGHNLGHNIKLRKSSCGMSCGKMSAYLHARMPGNSPFLPLRNRASSSTSPPSSSSSAAELTPHPTQLPHLHAHPACAVPPASVPVDPPASSAAVGSPPRLQAAAVAALLTQQLLIPGTAAAAALAVHAEPSNALSLPTWAIHVSSTVEVRESVREWGGGGGGRGRALRPEVAQA